MSQVINASGVILHTGLGRARLAHEARKAVDLTAADHVNLEVDLDNGRRGDRQNHVRKLLVSLTGAESALVVNNCAAAVFLCLHALAFHKEVLLSRGQMVEIGGSFRLPDIVKQSGCKLVEVGTTNKTRLSDFENAITPRTAAILRCHPSNYKVVGFTEEPSAESLVTLCDKNALVLIDDLGSGCLVDTQAYGLPHTTTLGEAVKSATVVTASGDKLLGGPQAGLILGKADTIKKLAKHALARAVRIDKLSLAALEATLRLYGTGRQNEIPTLRYMSRSLREVEDFARELQQAYVGDAVVEEGITEVGGGSLPGCGLPTIRVGLKGTSAEAAARKLRTGKPPVLARIEKDILWLDPRTLEPHEVTMLAKILRELR